MQGAIQAGQTIIYNDGRKGHQDVSAIVLSVTPHSMTVQFEDRADTTTIRFDDSAWMDYLRMS